MAQVKQVNVSKQFTEDSTLYAVYVALHRVIPDFRDGFKDVQRKIIYAMYNDFNMNRTAKSSAIVGKVMQKYHPHGDTAIYGAMKPMTNWFETNMPLIEAQGNFGNFQGDGASASRYTEAKLSKFAQEAVIGELVDHKQVVDWEENYDGSVLVPEYLSPKVPLLLINGSFGIAVGIRVDIPAHNINEVIDTTLNLIDHPNAKVVLVPDTSMECDIIETDFKTISELGYGNYVVRGRIDEGEFKGKPALFIHSIPNMTYLDTITDKIELLIANNKLTQVQDLFENSTEDKLEYVIILKKGADANFVKETIFKETNMQVSTRVNLEVLCERHIVRMSYKDYLLRFIDFRKTTKLRLYFNLLQDKMTKWHERDAYIRVLKSGEIDDIINRIKNRSDSDTELIEYMVKKFKITDLQASTIINSPLKYLSKLYLNKYIEEAKKLKEIIEVYKNKIQNEKELEREIKDELIEYKKKYGRPRNAKIISKAQASDIPEGLFKIVITENNFIRKIGIDEPLKAVRGDAPKLAIKVNNIDNLVLFDSAGKAYSQPVHKIPLCDKSSSGTDIRFLNKKITADIINIFPEEDIKKLVETKGIHVVVLTKAGFIKKLDVLDFTTLTTGGLFYVKMDQDDTVQDIIIGGNLDVVVYSDKKALRFHSKDIPLLRRSAKGVKSMGGKTESVDGICFIGSINATDVITVTKNGYVNRFGIEALPVGKRTNAGNSVIKLSKTDSIKSIHVVSSNDVIYLVTDKGPLQIPVGEIPAGSSISAGNKVTDGKTMVIKSRVIRA